MHFLKTIITTAAALVAIASAVPTARVTAASAVPTAQVEPIDAQVEPVDAQVESVDAQVKPVDVERRQNLNRFTIGYALCGWATIAPGGQPSGGSREDMFFWPGRQQVGCVEHSNSPLYTWRANGNAGSQFSAKVCGIDFDFYKNGNNYHFYRRGHDSYVYGSCVPVSGTSHFCLSLGFGSCSVSAKWYCTGNQNVQSFC